MNQEQITAFLEQRSVREKIRIKCGNGFSLEGTIEHICPHSGSVSFHNTAIAYKENGEWMLDPPGYTDGANPVVSVELA